MKYPRQRRARIRKFRVFLLVAVLGGCVLALGRVFSGTTVPARLTPETPPPVAEALPLVPETSPTAVQQPVPAPAPNSREASPARVAAVSPSPAEQAPALQSPPPPSLPVRAEPVQEPLAEASEGPMAGLSLDQAATALTPLVSGREPRVWGENLLGVTVRLSPEQVRKARDVAPILAHGAVKEGLEDDSSRPVLALTLDLCGGKAGSSYDERIIRLLREHGIPATIFVTSLWMRVNKEILADLAADPLFEIAAHGARHKPCSVNGRSAFGITGTASLRELVFEVEDNARDLAASTGRRPLWFRSGTAHYDEVAVQVLQKLELEIAGYSVAADQGATLPADKVAARVLGAKSGDILLAHLNKPGSGTYEGLARALPELLRRGAIFIQLSFGG